MGFKLKVETVVKTLLFIKQRSKRTMKLITKLLLTTIAVMISTFMLSGISIIGLGHNFSTITLLGIKDSFYLAVLLSILNATVKPLLKILTLPFTLVTFGLFLLVVNAIVIELADWLMDSFQVTNFWWALIFSIILTIVQWILNKVFNSDENGNGNSLLLDQHGNIIS
jgi:putative membrane protein